MSLPQKSVGFTFSSWIKQYLTFERQLINNNKIVIQIDIPSPGIESVCTWCPAVPPVTRIPLLYHREAVPILPPWGRAGKLVNTPK